jgi:hypothetical protein
MTTALGGDPNDKGIRHIDPKRLQQFNTLQQGMIEAGDPNAKNSQYVLDKFENSLGNDPTEQPEGAMDVPPDLQAGFDYAAKHGGRVPSVQASQNAPTHVGDSPYPEGTKLTKDGKQYIVKNGQPVPL